MCQDLYCSERRNVLNPKKHIGAQFILSPMFADWTHVRLTCSEHDKKGNCHAPFCRLCCRVAAFGQFLVSSSSRRDEPRRPARGACNRQQLDNTDTLVLFLFALLACTTGHAGHEGGRRENTGKEGDGRGEEGGREDSEGGSHRGRAEAKRGATRLCASSLPPALCLSCLPPSVLLLLCLPPLL